MCCQESKKVPDVPEPFCVKKLFFCAERIHVIIDSIKIGIDRFDRSAFRKRYNRSILPIRR